MSHMVVVSSSDSLKYHLNNVTTDFISEMVTPFHLDGSWEIALIDMHLSASSNAKNNPINIYADVCVNSNVKGVLAPLLRHIPLARIKSMYHLQLSSPIYVPLNTCEVKRIRLYITDSEGATPAHLIDPLSCTLHIRKSIA